MWRPTVPGTDVEPKSRRARLIRRQLEALHWLERLVLAGDIIATGTPAGVGMGMTPPRWLVAGDVVRIRIDGIGELENPVV